MGKPDTECILQRTLGFISTFIHPYAHFGLFTYGYSGCFAKPLEASRDFKNPYTEKAVQSTAKEGLCTYIHKHIHIFQSAFPQIKEVLYKVSGDLKNFAKHLGREGFPELWELGGAFQNPV